MYCSCSLSEYMYMCTFTYMYTSVILHLSAQSSAFLCLLVCGGEKPYFGYASVHRKKWGYHCACKRRYHCACKWGYHRNVVADLLLPQIPGCHINLHHLTCLKQTMQHTKHALQYGDEFCTTKMPICTIAQAYEGYKITCVWRCKAYISLQCTAHLLLFYYG